MITWECDYPHSDCTWPMSPEVLMKSLTATGLPDDEIHMVTWENACRWYQFDPFEHRTREECTVGALRAQATDVDTTPREYGGFHVGDSLTLDKDNRRGSSGATSRATRSPEDDRAAPLRSRVPPSAAESVTPGGHGCVVGFDTCTR